MDIEAIAEQLVAGCREGRESENLEKLYAEDAVSVEAADMSGTGRETKGLDGIRAKHDWWDGTHQTVRQVVEGPFLHGEDRFAVIFDVVARKKETGQEHPMKEVAVYHVSGGKIVREEFFYRA